MGTELSAINKIHTQQQVSTLTVDALAQICEAEGVTVQSVCKALAEGLQSNTVPKLNNTGGVIEASVVADMPTRHKYMSSALEVLRLVKKEVMVVGTVEHQMNKADLDRIEGFINKVSRLESAAKSDPIQRGEAIEADFSSIRQE